MITGVLVMTYFISEVKVDSQVEYRDKGHGEVYPQIITEYSCITIWLASKQIDGYYATENLSIITQLV